MNHWARWAAPIASGLIRLWGRTWRVVESGPPERRPRRQPRTQRLVYSTWHGKVFAHAYLYRDLDVCIGVSLHSDGEIGAQFSRRLGFRSARGSSTRGGTRMLREMLDLAREGDGDLALTPDGPKGPLHRAKKGTLYLAARLGWPVIPTGLAVSRAKRLASWDGFLIPWPFARIVVVFGEPMVLPGKLSEAQVADYQRELEERMAAVEAEAERILRS